MRDKERIYTYPIVGMVGHFRNVATRKKEDNMKSYTAQIVHTEDSIKKLLECQDRICHTLLNYIGGTGSVILVILALMLQGKIGRISTMILSFIGCWFFLINRHRPRQMADDVLKQLKGRMPVIKFLFTDTGINVMTKGHQETIPYDQVTRLVEDDQYCYFFYKNKAAFMFGKHTAGNLRELKDFLKSKVKLDWTSNSNVLRSSLGTLIHDRKNTRIITKKEKR